MKQSTLISLIIFSLTINLFTAYTNAHSSKLRNKYLRGENATLGPHVSDNTTHKRSLLANTRATMTINSFENGGDGGGPSECDGQYHSNNLLIVALSTKWYNNGHRCLKYINIYYNNRSARAKVVDECDSNRDCGDNIVDASYAVWVALQVSESSDDWGEAQITWSDA